MRHLKKASTFLAFATFCIATVTVGSNAYCQENFPGFYFKMTLKGADGLILESSNLKLVKEANQDLQAMSAATWKAVPAGDGYFYLTTLTQAKKDLVLEGGSPGKDGELGGGAVMVPMKGAGAGTLWKAQKINGLYTLKNKYLGTDQFLMSKGQESNGLYMAGSTTGGGKYDWVFTQVGGKAAKTSDAKSDPVTGVVGHYELENASNAWHYIAINTAPDRGPFVWVNQAGKRWTVSTVQNGQPEGKTTNGLGFSEDSGYDGHSLEIVRDANGNVTHLKEYKKDAKQPFQTWVRKEQKPVGEHFKGVVGHYELENASNGWHYVAINTAPDRGPFAWVNRAGIRWTVSTELIAQPGGKKTYRLAFGKDSGTSGGYDGHSLEIERDANGNVTRLKEFKKDAKQPFQTWVRKK